MPSPELRAQLATVAGVIYFGMLVIAVIWRKDWLTQLRGLDGRTGALNFAIGAGVGLAVVVLFRLFKAVGPLRALEEELAKVLGRVDMRIAFYIALFSSVGEEALFRGAMQNAWGLHWASAIFGSLHVLNARTWIWMVLAWGMGYAMGGLYIWTGDLLAPVACHFVINFINLQLIGRRAAELGYQ